MSKALHEAILEFAKELSFPLEAVTQKFAFMGQSGGGKTYAAMKLAELMLAAGAQIVVIDIPGVWKGLRSSADGKSAGFKVLLVGGEDGDLPINANAGALIADMVVDSGLSVILDVSLMMDSEQLQFLTDFGARFFERKKKDKSPVHVFVEECQEVIPETLGGIKGAERLRSVFVRMMKIGRNFGIGWSAITQEPQAASKRALNMAGTIVAVRTVGFHERQALERWARSKAKSKSQLGLMDILPELQQSQALVWSPGWLRYSDVVHVLPKTTFDSSKTPEVGKKRPQAKVVAELDLEKLKTDMAGLVKQAEANDPKLLKRRIADLEKELSAKKISVAREYPVGAPAVPKTKTKVITIQQKVVLTKDAKALRVTSDTIERFREKLNEAQHAFHRSLTPILAKMEKLSGEVSKALGEAKVVDAPARTVTESEETPTARVDLRTMRVPPAPLLTGGEWKSESKKPAPTPKPPKVAATYNGEPLGGGESKMLEALAARHPNTLSRAQLGILAGYSSTGGTFLKYFSHLNTLGLIDAVRGGDVSLTNAALGLEVVKDAIARGPRGAEEVQAFWRETLGGGERAMFDVLLEHRGGQVSRQDLGAKAGYESTGGTFLKYLSKLNTLGLIDVERGGGISISRDLLEAA